MKSVLVAVSFLTFLGNLPLSAQPEFAVGRGIADITPPMGVPLDGAISQNGVVNSIHDPLHVRALLFRSGEITVGLITVDNTMISASLLDKAKTRIQSQTGIPGSHLIIAATHTHSTPRGVVGLSDKPEFEQYLDQLRDGIVSAVCDAAETFVPAKIGWTSLDVPEFVHNRRWFVEEKGRIANPFGEPGEVVRMNPGRENLIKPAGPVDPELFLLSVQCPEGNPLATMGNYGLHYVGGTGRGTVSADYFGIFSEALRTRLKADETFLGMMSNGTSGDVNAHDFTKPRQKYAAFEFMTEVGNELARKAIPALGQVKHTTPDSVAASETVLSLRVRKPDAERLRWARENAPVKNSPIRLTRPQVYAREALALSEYPDLAEVRIQAIRIGSLVIVGIPCEVFAETGLALKNANSSGELMIMELANGYHGYLPTEQQHRWGGYETWPARSSYLEVEAEEKIRNAARTLINTLER